jgi:hypothetical protein
MLGNGPVAWEEQRTAWVCAVALVTSPQALRVL